MSKPRGLIAALVSIGVILGFLSTILFVYSHNVLGLVFTLFAIISGLLVLHFELENHYGKRFRYISPFIGILAITVSVYIFANSFKPNDDFSERAVKIQTRAYIILKNFTMSPFADGKDFRVEILMVNSGQSDAHNIVAEFGFHYGGKVFVDYALKKRPALTDTPFRLQRDENREIIITVPAQAMTPSLVNNVKAGRVLIVLRGYWEFYDIWGDKHQEEYIVKFEPSMGKFIDYRPN